MNQAFHLFRLQQIDSQIDQVETALAEINRRLAGDETVRQAVQAVEQAEKALHNTQKTLKEAEFAVKEQQIKIQQTESTLYGGRVRSPKELQDLQKDIASLKKYLAALEDHQLEAMLAVEQVESDDKSAHHQLLEAQARFAEQSAGWVGQKDVHVRNLERLQAERSAALSLITSDVLNTYEVLRKRKSGLAVVTPKESSCSACGSSFRPSELQAARASQGLSFCSSCGRILYAG